MLVACRLADLSALETYYADVDAHAQLLTTSRPAGSCGAEQVLEPDPDVGMARKVRVRPEAGISEV